MKFPDRVKTAFLIILIGACSKDDPDPGVQQDNIEFLVEVSEEVGRQGGEIITDGFTLSVPPGGFSTSNQITISSAVDKTTFGEHLVSRLYKVEGIPENFVKPLKVKLKSEDELNNESYLAFGEEVYATSIDTLVTAYKLFNASDSAGWLIGEIPVPENDGQTVRKRKKSTRETDYPGFIMGCITNYASVFSENNHFYITYPIFMVSRADVIALARYLEEAYSHHKYELYFETDRRKTWPVFTHVKAFRKNYEAYGFYVNSIMGVDAGYLEFNYAYLDNHDLMRRTAAHEFLHLVQYLYDTRDIYSKCSEAAEHHWFNEATGLWVENFFTDEPNFRNDMSDGRQMEPFEGIHAGATGDPTNHGYGMLPLSNYLMGIWGKSTVIKVYRSVYEGMHVIDAIKMHTSDTDIWLEEFFRKYLMNELNIYNTESSFFLNNAHDEFLVSDKENFSEEIIDVFPDLSARFYKITFRDNSIKDDDKILLKLEGDDKNDAEISVFKWVRGQDARFEFVANAMHELSVRNLKNDYLDPGNRMVVMITNKHSDPDYCGTTPYILKISMAEEMPAPDYNRCGFMVKVLKHYHNTTPESSYDSDSDGSIGVWENYPGSFSGNTFTGNYSREYPTFTITGSITVELNTTQDTVSSIFWNETHNSPDFTKTYTFSGTDIPFAYSDIYQSEGESACDHILSFTVEQIAPEGLNYSMTGFECNWSSKVYLSFSKVTE